VARAKALPSPSLCSADVDGDGAIGVCDLLHVIDAIANAPLRTGCGA
jgi:hypothetical protein